MQCRPATLVCKELGLPVSSIRPDPRLIEVGFGDWEMQQVDVLHSRFPALAAQVDWYFQASNCEPYEKVVSRIEQLLNDPELPPRLIVVAHGLLGRILRCVYAGLSFEALWQQDMPQDAFFRLQDGSISRLACLPVAEERPLQNA